MPGVVPPLAFFCIASLAPFPDQLHDFHHRRVPASPDLLDALPHASDPSLWAALAQLVHPLPSHLHERDIPLSHPDLPLLQKISNSPDFSLLTLVSLPNCVRLHDDDVANLRTLHCLVALDFRGCSISSYALTALARGLDDSTRTGSWGLRLLSLHGCHNIDNDVLSALRKFPLLSAVDLRFTRCTPTAVNASLSSLGFRPSNNNSLFHPVPLSWALCTLEKVAHSSPDPISLYSCPPELVFRVHIVDLGRKPSRPKKVVPIASSSTSRTGIRTISSGENIMVYIPPLRKLAKNESRPPPKRSAYATVVSESPTSTPIDFSPIPSLSPLVQHSRTNILPLSDQPARSDFFSPISSLSALAWDTPSRANILPMSAQVVSSEDSRPNPLAIARPPPPWKILAENPPQKQPIVRQALDNPLKVDRARLQKRGSDTVADMVHNFASKRLKVESEFALAKTRAAASVKSRNPFVRSVFAEKSTKTFDKPPGSNPKEPQMRTCSSLPSKTEGRQGTDNIEMLRSLKPITMLKPPILPKELLPPSSQRASKLKQTRLSF